jgi:hypothetical protein
VHKVSVVVYAAQSPFAEDLPARENVEQPDLNLKVFAYASITAVQEKFGTYHRPVLESDIARDQCVPRSHQKGLFVYAAEIAAVVKVIGYDGGKLFGQVLLTALLCLVLYIRDGNPEFLNRRGIDININPTKARPRKI